MALVIYLKSVEFDFSGVSNTSCALLSAMTKRLNIISFSKQAGVSVATVSRALNPKTSHMVKEETRRRIQDLDRDRGAARRHARRST